MFEEQRMMRWTTIALCTLGIYFPYSHGLSAEVARSRLAQAFSSPSGKLTISPEIVIPEPNDPTALLLLTNAVQTLSERIRSAKANTAFVQGTVSALNTFAAEQETSRGNFPGPVPIVACSGDDNLSELTDVDGVMIAVCDGAEISSPQGVTKDWQQKCQTALSQGVQPIPEVTIGEATAAKWSEDDVKAMIESLKVDRIDPVAVVVTINRSDIECEEPVALPTIPKALARSTPILGSIRVKAGDNRLSIESQRYKQAGFTGALLRSDCVPGFRLNPDMDIVGKFWSLCVEDLKSTRSKSFSFRSKNNMEKNAATNWAKYQKGVLDSGALGDPSDNYSIVDDANGDYKGFA